MCRRRTPVRFVSPDTTVRYCVRDDIVIDGTNTAITTTRINNITVISRTANQQHDRKIERFRPCSVGFKDFAKRHQRLLSFKHPSRYVMTRSHVHAKRVTLLIFRVSSSRTPSNVNVICDF